MYKCDSCGDTAADAGMCCAAPMKPMEAAHEDASWKEDTAAAPEAAPEEGEQSE